MWCWRAERWGKTLSGWISLNKDFAAESNKCAKSWDQTGSV
jgi:hypothetical protein